MSIVELVLQGAEVWDPDKIESLTRGSGNGYGNGNGYGYGGGGGSGGGGGGSGGGSGFGYGRAPSHKKPTLAWRFP